jgi:hypothetical protein
MSTTLCAGLEFADILVKGKCMKVSQRVVGVAAAMVAVVGFAACTADAQDFKREAEGLITGTLAKDIGLGDLKAACDKPEKKTPIVGDTFKCTATTKDGEVIELLAEVDKPKHFNVNTTNLVAADAVPKYGEAAAGWLANELGIDLASENMDCGAKSLVLQDNKMQCAVTDPSTGDVYDATVTIADDFNSIENVEVAEEPRG